ncbi:hypothetical protein BsWGS_16199 [Bradybaena similaris]
MEPYCSVCWANLDFTSQEIQVLTCCGHVAHAACFVDWLSNSKTCPVCRVRVRKGQNKRLYLDTRIDPRFEKLMEENDHLKQEVNRLSEQEKADGSLSRVKQSQARAAQEKDG